jgi:DNA-binding response OmpR family regulator
MSDREKAKKQTAVTAVLRLDVANAQVWCGERLLKLTPRAFAVLHYLSDHAGRLVTKDELMQTVWTDTVVTDGALATSIRELRRARSTLKPCIGGGIGSSVSSETPRVGLRHSRRWGTSRELARGERSHGG